jgi:hypothetical protein
MFNLIRWFPTRNPEKIANISVASEYELVRSSHPEPSLSPWNYLALSDLRVTISRTLCSSRSFPKKLASVQNVPCFLGNLFWQRLSPKSVWTGQVYRRFRSMISWIFEGYYFGPGTAEWSKFWSHSLLKLYGLKEMIPRSMKDWPSDR